MSTRKLILVLAAYFPDSYGGAERQAHILASALGQRGVDVTLVAPTIDAKAPLREDTEFGRIIRKRVSSYPNLGGRNMLSFGLWSRWFQKTFTKETWHDTPIYVFHARLHAFGPYLSARNNGAKLFIKLGGGGEASEFAALEAKKFWYGQKIRDLLLKNTSGFVANSGAIANELAERGVDGNRIYEFPNGVELPDLKQWDTLLEQRNGHRFIYAGRLIPDKQIDVLYQATANLVAAGKNIQLTLLGTGSEKDRLEPLSVETGHETAFRFPGFVTDVYPELIRSDFFLCASRREGQSNALLEAMSAGLIPIVYDASGVREVVQHGENGFVLSDSTPAAFQAAMEHALSLSTEERQTLSENARRFAEDHIGIDAVAKKTEDMIFGGA
ncbi:MAG: hypothetical protein CMK09_11665 [Ponticaulis sp.]|nr:hypothetical protein [Ponticaulis sp.]|tara:strand:+ start:3757 stop:4911 length:1155 start_codon:yes stop_codon:yes gene_type:complete